MRRIALISIITAALAVAIAGCGGAASWREIGPQNSRYSGKLGFSADLPAGWAAFEDAPSRTLLLTRHSVPMDFIQIRRHPLSEPLPNTSLSINAGMQPYEAAEAVVNNLRAGSGVFDLTVEELMPDTIDGRAAFSLLLSYSLENGLRRRCLIYGIVHGNRRYTEAGLYALDDHYFGATVGDFLALVRSLKIKD